MRKGFVIYKREGGYNLLINDPNAFLLLSCIAFRAKRTEDNAEYSTFSLGVNQAFIGDYREIGLSRGEYRSAKKRLKLYGLADFTTNNKGTIATLTSTDVIDINADQCSTAKEPKNPSIKIHMAQPSKLQPKDNQEPLTKKKKTKEETTTKLPMEVSLYECLEKNSRLSHEDKKGFLIYPEERVQKALEWGQSQKVKRSFAGLIHWHCKQEEPPEKSLPLGTEQQVEAWQYNQFLKEKGFDDLCEKNLLAIPENYVYVILDGGRTTISLNNSPNQVRAELEKSKRELFAQCDAK